MRLMCWELYKIHLYFENILIEYFLNGWAERHFSADQIAEDQENHELISPLGAWWRGEP